MADQAKFTKRKLPGTRHCSMPLLIPNDTTYVLSDNALKKIPGEERTSLKLVPEALELLKSIVRPLAVLAIGGPCRTGKSYILSRILGTADAFGLGHTFDPETLGIWIGTTVLDCDSFTVLLMDTEGIDSVFAKSRDDGSILVMTILLSSFFMYNSLGVPHHGDLDKLSYFGNLASCIAVDASQEDMNAFDYKSYFPDFLWLLRDVHLLPTGNDGNEVTPTEYLVSTVLRRGKSFKATDSDEVGRAILTFFPSVECETLPSPSDNPEIVRNITQNQESLNPIFNEQVEQLIQYFHRRLRPKRGFAATNTVDGPILAAMAEEYLKAINAPGAIPCISDTWNIAVERHSKEVMEKLIMEYTQELESRMHEVGIPMEEDSSDDIHAISNPRTMFGIHRFILLRKTESMLKRMSRLVSVSSEIHNQESLAASLEHSTAIFEEESEYNVMEGKEVKGKKVTGGVLYKFAQQNHSKSRSACIALFEKLYQQIQEKMFENQQYSFEELLEDLKLLQLNYFKEAVGPAKWEVYDEKKKFVKDQEENFRVLKGFQQQTYNAIQKAAEESAKAAKVADGVNKVQVQMRNDTELNQKRMEAMQKECQEEMERLRQEEAERVAQEEKKDEDFKAAHMQDMANMSEEHHEEMKKQNERMMQMLGTMESQNKKEISTLTSSVDKLTDKIGKMSTPGEPNWGERLFQVGLKALEAGAMAAAASKCSLM